jgi:hypothetical protein
MGRRPSGLFLVLKVLEVASNPTAACRQHLAVSADQAAASFHGRELVKDESLVRCTRAHTLEWFYSHDYNFCAHRILGFDRQVLVVEPGTRRPGRDRKCITYEAFSFEVLA